MHLLINGEALRLPLKDNSVHCVVTSPPYWSLRSYGTPPCVWGGALNCEHLWGEWVESHEEREAAIAGKTRTSDRCYGAESRRFDGNHQKHAAGAFCRLCSAWRGELGLEPDPDCGAAGSPNDMMELRDDLSEEDQQYVVAELLKRGLLR